MSSSPTFAAAARARWTFVAVAAVAGVFAVGHGWSWRFLCDDAYISFRYAENLAVHGEAAFNVAPLEKVEGYTNPLWVFVLALGAKLGIAPPVFAPILCFLGSGLGLFAACGLTRALRLRGATAEARARAGWRVADLLPAVLLAVWPEYMVWSGGGLETSSAVACGLGALWMWTAERWNVSAALAAAALLLRMDAAVWLGAYVLTDIVLGALAAPRQLRERAQGLPWKKLAVALGVFVLPLAIHAVWRHSYYGHWLPHTWALKKHGALVREAWGEPYVDAWVTNVRVLWLAPLLVLARPAVVPALVGGSAMVLYAWSVGGDFMAYSRFLVPATTLVAVVVGAVVARGEDWLRDRGRPSFVLPLLVFGFAGWHVSGLAQRWQDDVQTAWLDDRWEGVTAMDRFARIRVHAGEAFARVLRPDTRVTVGAAGAMPYGAKVFVYDVYGLVDPGVLDVAKPAEGRRGRPGHQFVAPLRYMKRRKPDLMCHLGAVNDSPRLPRREARRRAGRGWTWACVETGAMEEPRTGETLDSVFYCCLRPTDRPSPLEGAP